MKRTKLFLLVTAVFSILLCTALNASALTEGDWEFELLDDEVKITGYLGTDSDIVIPDTIYGCPVTKVEAYSVSFDNATSIVYPKGLKVLECNFKAGSSNKTLKYVVLPEGLEVIADYAFQGCNALESVNIPSTVKKIGSSFKWCYNLKNIVFPAGLEIIEYEAFLSSGLEHVDLSHTSAKLEEEVFEGCENLKTVKLPANLKKLPDHTFSGCTSLVNVEIPSTVEWIGGFAFLNCTSLESIILPTSLKKIYEFGSFSNCDSLKEIVIPYGVTQIGGHAIENCDSLKAVYLPDTVTSLGNLAITEGSPNAIIYCTKGSKAAEYCKKEEISYLTDNSVNTGIHVYYNGTRVSFHAYGQNPELLQSRTLVPLRSIFEAMGAQVEWDAATSTAVAKRGKVEVKIQIGASEMQKNGAAVALDVPAQLLNDRTMVPVRVIAEAFGADVSWNGNGRAVLINE